MPNDPLKLASEALQKAIDSEKRNRKLLDSIGPAIIQSLSPVLSRIEQAVSRIKVDVQPRIEVNPRVPAPIVNVPDVIVPEIHVPTPIVNYTPPAINIPRMEMPGEMNIKGWVGLMGVSLENPLPVQLRNADGSPVNLDITQYASSGGGSRGVVKVSGYDGSAFGSMLNADGRLRVETNDGTSSASTEVKQVSGAVDSVIVNDVLVTVGVNQVSGASWSTAATIQNTTLAVTQSGTWDEVGINDSGNSITIDTTQSFEVKQVSGFVDSVFVTGSADSMLAYQGRTTNPTAVSDGGDVRPSADDLGRTLTRPIQVRDLIVTAFATITDSSEDTLISGVASTYLDLIYIMAANESNAAVNLAFRTGTGGSVMFELEVPATSTAGVSLPVPIPASEVAQAWTVQNTGSDNSNTTVNISALFSKEI